MTFEKHLTEKGWTKTAHDWRANRFEPWGQRDYSTNGHLVAYWFGPGVEWSVNSAHIMTGLNEHKHSPTLVHPRPIECVVSSGDGVEMYGGPNATDEMMGRAFEVFKDEEILSAILNKNKLRFEWQA